MIPTPDFWQIVHNPNTHRFCSACAVFWTREGALSLALSLLTATASLHHGHGHLNTACLYHPPDRNSREQASHCILLVTAEGMLWQ